MKKKIGYILLILISVLGSRLIFGKDYHLNSNNLIENNLYMYNIFNNKKVVFTMVDNEYLYYVLESKNNLQYEIIKHNLISNKVVSQYMISTAFPLEKSQLFLYNGNLYFTALNSKIFYKFNKQLELIDEYDVNNVADSYSVYHNQMVTTLGNEINYQGKVYDTLPNSCGRNIETIYNSETYLHFHNSDTGFGCLYNLNSKQREYLDYEKILIINNRLLEYQDNRISFKYDGITYYFNDITESNNLKMHINGDYLFTIDTTTSTLRIYNIETSKIIYQKTLIELKDATVDNILIDDYAYFTVTRDKNTRLYIWDYLKETRTNKDMISYDEKEYKFKNNELKEEIKSKYNVDVYIYDQGVTYLENIYVIPSYDDILINSRLNTLKEILDRIDASTVNIFNGLTICLDKDIISINKEDNPSAIITMRNNLPIIAINITDDNFRTNMLEKLNILNPIIGNIFNISS